jgi:hypothetical protein
MALRYSLSTLLNWTILICFLLWICQLSGGGELLAGIGFWIAAVFVFICLFRVGSILFGIPGDRQRKQANKRSEVPAKLDK